MNKMSLVTTNWVAGSEGHLHTPKHGDITVFGSPYQPETFISFQTNEIASE